MCSAPYGGCVLVCTQSVQRAAQRTVLASNVCGTCPAMCSGMSNTPLLPLSVLTLASLSVGCAHYSTIHQPYTPLLDHQGQADVAIRGGVTDDISVIAAAQGAYSPVNNLVVAANVDVDVDTGSTGPNVRGGGGVAVGTYVNDRVLRAELLVGVNGGYGSGGAFHRCAISSAGSCTSDRYALTGPYVSPFAQGMVGFEIPHFEFAGGLRLQGGFADIESRLVSGDTPPSMARQSLEQLLLEPFVTLRFPMEFARFEITGGLPVTLAGDVELAGQRLSSVRGYVTFGVGFQFDP